MTTKCFFKFKFFLTWTLAIGLLLVVDAITSVLTGRYSMKGVPTYPGKYGLLISLTEFVFGIWCVYMGIRNALKKLKSQKMTRTKLGDDNEGSGIK